MEIGRKLYYEKSTGNIIIDTGERSGSVIETTQEQDFELYTSLAERVPETVGMLRLEYGQYAEDFRQCNGYRISIVDEPFIVTLESVDGAFRPADATYRYGCEYAAVKMNGEELEPDRYTIDAHGTVTLLPEPEVEPEEEAPDEEEMEPVLTLIGKKLADIEFSYPDPEQPGQPPVFRKPLTEQVAEQEQRLADIELALADIFSGGGE